MEGALIADANVGGESVRRGSILGGVIGASSGDPSLPAELEKVGFSISYKSELEREIEDLTLRHAAVLSNRDDSGDRNFIKGNNR